MNAGGLGFCANDGAPVFTSRDDADYQALLSLCIAGHERLEEMKRFDMPAFHPPAAYVREMQRYGILPADLPAGASIDPYATDQEYWRSLWYEPPVH